MKQFKIIVEKHSDGYVAYPLRLRGVVIGAGDSYEEAVADVKSAIAYHIETFGRDVVEAGSGAFGGVHCGSGGGSLMPCIPGSR